VLAGPRCSAIAIVQVPIRTSLALRKVISGGQTGVDRGALDAALSLRFACGGACPAHRRAEDGAVPTRYPVIELPGAGYRQRTLRNVLDSHATALLHRGRLTGGSLLAARYCARYSRPVCTIDASRYPAPRAARCLKAFCARHAVQVLNVAGPRASAWRDGRKYSRDTISALLRLKPARRRQRRRPRIRPGVPVRYRASRRCRIGAECALVPSPCK
jgi:hypothetical protein